MAVLRCGSGLGRERREGRRGESGDAGRSQDDGEQGRRRALQDCVIGSKKLSPVHGVMPLQVWHAPLAASPVGIATRVPTAKPLIYFESRSRRLKEIANS